MRPAGRREAAARHNHRRVGAPILWTSELGGMVRRRPLFIRRPHVFVVELKWRFGMYSAGHQAVVRDFMQRTVRIRGDITGPDAPQDDVNLSVVDHEAGGCRFAQHPCQWNFGCRTLCFWIAAADVAVHTREPNLFQIFRAAVGGRRLGAPQVGAEKRPGARQLRSRGDQFECQDCRRQKAVAAGSRSSRPNSPCPIRRRTRACMARDRRSPGSPSRAGSTVSSARGLPRLWHPAVELQPACGSRTARAARCPATQGRTCAAATPASAPYRRPG